MNFQEYYEAFKAGPLWAIMENTVENSPWHREANVAVHTDMVLKQYQTRFMNTQTETEQLVAQIALLFHDTGKPEAEETLEKKDGSGEKYRRYAGHEQHSAVSFQEEYVRCEKLRALLTPKQARAVRWIIEHHLPYGMKDVQKRSALAKATFGALNEAECSYQTFFHCLRSDAAGRISDDHQTKLENVETWISEFEVLATAHTASESTQTMVLLIGPSGSGKSTYVKARFNADTDAIISMDTMKVEFYDATFQFTDMSVSEKYDAAWDYANEKETLFKAFAMAKARDMVTKLPKHGTVFVDITNLSKKRRAPWLDLAKTKGGHRMKFEAVEFWNQFETLASRQKTRGDKSVPRSSVAQQVQAQTCAWFGTEADTVTMIVGEPYVV